MCLNQTATDECYVDGKREFAGEMIEASDEKIGYQ